MALRSRDYRGSSPRMNGRLLSLGATWYRLPSVAAQHLHGIRSATLKR